jgi:hypothetical protein
MRQAPGPSCTPTSTDRTCTAEALRAASVTPSDASHAASAPRYRTPRAGGAAGLRIREDGEPRGEVARHQSCPVVRGHSGNDAVVVGWKPLRRHQPLIAARPAPDEIQALIRFGRKTVSVCSRSALPPLCMRTSHSCRNSPCDRDDGWHARGELLCRRNGEYISALLTQAS